MIKFISKLLYMIPVKGKVKWLIFIACAVISFGSFISIDSAWADDNKINGLLTVIGVVFGLITVAFFLVAKSESDQDNDPRL